MDDFASYSGEQEVKHLEMLMKQRKNEVSSDSSAHDVIIGQNQEKQLVCIPVPPER
jgi:hypothetical protein